MLSSLKEAFTQTDELILITDSAIDPSKANILFANDAFLDFTGFTSDELKSLATVQSPEIDPETLSTYMVARRMREVFNGILLGEMKSGLYFWVNLTVIPFHDKQTDKWIFVHKPQVMDE